MDDPKKPGLGDDLLKAAAKSPIQAIKGAAISTIKSGVQKINPFDKKINTSDVSDTGIESLRLGYTTAKQGKNAVKTTAQTIKTTQRTIKTAGKAAKETGHTVIRVVKTTVRVTAATVKLVGKGVGFVVSVVPFPILVILIAVIFLLIMMMGAVTTVMGGAAAASNSVHRAYEEALGLDDPVADYAEGTGFYATAIKNAQNAFDATIDGLYYSDSEKSKSDLVYFKTIIPESPDLVLYTDHSEFPTDTEKTKMKSAWSPYLSETEVLAIAYVYMQKQENDANGTDGMLYMVDFTQDTLDTVVEALYSVTDTTYEKQQCHDQDCDVEQVPNPDWTLADQYVDYFARLIDRFHGNMDITIEGYTRKTAGEQYEYWLGQTQTLPKTIDHPYCPKKHTTHSLVLNYYDMTSVLMQLDISEDKYAQWVNMTITAFEAIENSTNP